MSNFLNIDKMPNNEYDSKEAFNILRTNIQFAGEDIKVVQVTSCAPGEGKSYVTLQLARSFGAIGKKVLYIDIDLRRSVLIGRYRINVGRKVKGLTHYLSGQCNRNEIFYESNVKNMDMILSGHITANPTALLGSSKFKELISQARDEYDYVFVDCPPIGSVIDAAIVAPFVDGTVLVIENNRTSYKFILDSKKQMERAGAKIIGVVLNKVDRSNDGYYKKYYGKYYGKYQSDEK